MKRPHTLKDLEGVRGPNPRGAKTGFETMEHALLSDASQRLAEMVRAAPHLMRALMAVRQLDLQSWCIGAGAIRTLAWDSLHGFEEPSPLEDVDVVYFDDSAHAPWHEAELQRRLTTMMPGLRWEVTNQATVHHWFLNSLGQVVPPLRSLEEGISTWPEFATCVGVSLKADDSLQIVAPHGLDDLFALRVRHNSVRASAQTFMARVSQKQFAQRWPRLQIVPATEEGTSAPEHAAVSRDPQ